MKIVILAAGEGSRLRPFTKNIPKCLVKINNLSTLEIQLNLFRGEYETILIGGYLHEKLEDKADLLLVNSKYDSTNMLYTFFLAAEYFNDDIMVSYGDIAYTRTIFEKIVKSSAEISVAVDLNWEEYWDGRSENPLEDLETMKIVDDSILTLGDIPKSKLEIDGQYMGLMKFSKDAIKVCHELYEKCRLRGRINGKNFDQAYFTDFIQEIINNGHKVTPVFNEEPWIEIDTVTDLQNPNTIYRANLISNLNEK